MSSLNSIDRKLLEDALGMSGGYVLNFTARREFAMIMREMSDFDIYANIYEFNGNSMANRLRAFWEIENDTVTASALKQLLDYAEAFQLTETDKIVKCRNIVNRLTGVKAPQTALPTKEVFLSREFPHLDFQKLPIEAAFISVIEDRREEAKRCAGCEAYLSTVILLGSMLEAILLGVATHNPKLYNQAASAPKKDGKVKPFHKWSLANLIDTARELRIINEDVKKFSHALRDFRNYVHPYEQKAAQFTPDKDTANISFQVFRAAMNQITKTQ